MSSLPTPPSYFHPGAPHVRIPQKPPAPGEARATPFTSDFDLWVQTGQWEQVSSSNVSAIAYDLARHMIKVRYHGGVEWGYFPYSLDEARRMYSTGSKGIASWDLFRIRGRGTVHMHQRGAMRI